MSTRSNLTVANRLALGFGGVTFLGLLIAALSAYEMQDVNQKLDSLAKDRMVKVEQLTEVKDDLNVIARSVRNIALMADDPPMTRPRAARPSCSGARARKRCLS